MVDCKKCGKNNWGWKCEQGIMTGFCRTEGCNEKTNSFKARSGSRYEGKTKDVGYDKNGIPIM